MADLITIPAWITWELVNVSLIILTILLTVFFARSVDHILSRQFKIVSKKMNVDQTSYRVVRHTAVASIYIFGILVVVNLIPSLEALSITLFASAGFAGIVLGLAAQSTLSNIISGISLAAFRPFRVGDLVTIRDEYGRITDITLRHTVVRTWDNRRLIIPNSVISEESIINWSIEDPTVNWPIDIGISYDSDIDKARHIMICEARKQNGVMTFSQLKNYHPDIKKEEVTSVRVRELGDFAVILRLLIWVEDRDIAYDIGCDIREAVKKRFDAEGIEIPFPYRTIVYKKDMESN
ncbi:mechanosensitive ion channel family protein [Methanolobus mangrovi]|uniref:Mechanosensitive ion channel family protein n=1 Tax=Methanolobus mangrovi TaxID=3072977 RepID=A0AA51UFV6_9EURY|nr:mechanosensitive ion channel family protein [Methanolobus mangrovi]WMW22423.1 mechanosensitive ion channel family protein [Methanolobus mangrovi]